MTDANKESPFCERELAFFGAMTASISHELNNAIAIIDLQLQLVARSTTGDDRQEQRLREQVKKLSLEEAVVFTGRVPHDEVQRYYNLVDLFVYPRHPMRLTDLVTPLKPLEAMAQGKLLIASDVGGHRELIRSGETGELFAAGDAGALTEVTA